MPNRLLAGVCVAAIALVLLALACGGDDNDTPAVTAAAICAATPEFAGTVASALIETSGLASSRTNDNVLWAHNDSGDTARVYALGSHGEHRETYMLAGAEAIDWEDMAIGPGPDGDGSYLYLADIGDNDALRPEVVVYRVAEPKVIPTDTPTDHTLTGVESITLRYPDRAHDAETFLVDPEDGDMLIVTKELGGGASLVFRAPPSASPAETTTLEQVADIDFAALGSAAPIPTEAPPLVRGLPNLPTGGDVSPDGSLIAIRTYGTVWVFVRAEGAPLWDAFHSQACEAPSVIEPQGEAIAFDADGLGYTTIGEGASSPVNHFEAAPD